MINITLSDGSQRHFNKPITGLDIAKDISAGLSKEAIAIKVNDKIQDLKETIKIDCSIEILTKKSPETLEIIRHDAAHIMAEAVQDLFPDTLVSIGPPIKDGFYYDFEREESFTPDDFKKIEKKMHEIIKANKPFEKEIWSKKEAVKYFNKKQEKYKIEIINDIDDSEELSIYKQGLWIDLCKGPHSPSTKFVGNAFKILKLSGAYWRGDSRNKMLQRIYATAWFKDSDLQLYLKRIEEAEKRDHRKLGKDLNLFHLQDEAIGSIFWHPKGWTVYRICEEYVRKKLNKAKYQEVKTPSLIDRKLWEESGHWEKFRENMFITEGEDKKPMALKPMNCPAHVQIFKQGIKSYKDLPIRIAEFGSCHRNEPSGALHGLMRVRAFTQDDAHIFCTEDQINSETQKFCQLLMEIYNDFGFKEINIKFSDRPEVRAGEDKIWDKAENSLQTAIDKVGLPYTKDPGQGAFYGPKLDFILTDTIGREWQCGTLQVDFVLPDRLNANYIDINGNKKRPVMLHRAILGSIERFIGVLIENTAGNLPLWLSPVQIAVASISDDAREYAGEVYKYCEKNNLRTQLDIRNEKINYKIREHSNNKVPIILVVGKKEIEENTVSIRRLGSDKQEIKPLKIALANIKKEAYTP
ncbi:MAG: Threonine--tRNA ligase [Alphaproteobacteria bacterium MarineAlpha5_Bin11]|nr:threonine--tRNA ligase [Pelagibacteraceae bacterium]PPR44739.1 MAG: Threonine--tRNA ligase [Alphaproteobacteria bacterium MarineAlpha5_Bin11]PPR52177.1 MAG: Threonine--tRNA ligase [Alphaproteobacteria bacterium MarineAlpha5_Bin10]|tara:strand:+ start:21300 stop:23210 length:1911 start_codon:yes stop_codon:yes gene_type:complete